MPSKPTTKAGKRGPRKKTGCLTCRARHMRCDEAQPKCSACSKSGLICERTSIIVFAPEPEESRALKSRHLRKPSLGPSTEYNSHDDQIAFLLRRYQDGIGVWMDLFDHRSTYQIMMMKEVAGSELLKRCVCALSARQQALIHAGDTKLMDWNAIAEQHYGKSLRLLQDSLEFFDHALPASILLLSYELMSFPGQDYTRHFFGAKSLIESHPPSRIRENALLSSSRWIFLRHDVDLALGNEKPPALRMDRWSYESVSKSIEEDDLGNLALVIAAKVVHHVFGDNHADCRTNDQTTESLLNELNKWQIVARDRLSVLHLSGGKKLYATSAGASAMQTILVSRMLLSLYSSQASSKANIEVQDCAQQIIDISLNHLSDAAQVQAVHYLYHAAKHINDNDMRTKVISLFIELQQRTGFHTQSKVDALNGLP